MDLFALLHDKSLKTIEKREIIIKALDDRKISIKELQDLISKTDEKRSAVAFEAMEAVTNPDADIADIEWLRLAEMNILSENNNIKREASRIVGNISSKFPDDLEEAIEKLLINSKDKGTVIRWSSAYALSRIILIPKYANSKLFDTLSEICNSEKENGVKNQYIKALKKASKMRP
jgi:hypothetical protein